MNTSIKITKTTSENLDFINLTGALDDYLWKKYPELKSNYWGNNVIEINTNVILIFLDNKAVACGCFKKQDANTIELKRMFVLPEARGKGLAIAIINELEKAANKQGFSVAVLETLYNQDAAISLYQKAGFEIIENYEPYIGNKNSICMRKQLET